MTADAGVRTAATLAERAGVHALDVLAQVTEDDLASPTPCPDWDVRNLLLHVADAAALLAGLAATGERRPAGASNARSEDPVEAARMGVQRLLETLRVASASASADGAAGRDDDPPAWQEAAYGTGIELTTHTWDLATSLGAEVPVPDGLAAEVLDLATGLVGDEQRAEFFGPRIEVEPTARAGDRLAGFLGRDPAWRDRLGSPL